MLTENERLMTMARLLYSAIASLDGYTEDADGRFEWAAPSEQVHRFVNELERPIGTYLYGRLMYETMVYWETVEVGPAQPEVINDYATIWRAAEKVVYSRTLETVTSTRTRVERAFEPDAVRRLKEESATDLSIGGAQLAGEALAAGLVDEVSLFLVPAVVGGGRPALPAGLRSGLRLLDERRFDSGVVYVRYAVG
jgi:dihydrofolate reductase